MNTTIASLGISSEQDVVTVRQFARDISSLLDFGQQDQVRIATAVSELARNAFSYASGGEVEFLINNDQASPSLDIRIRSSGGGFRANSAVLEGEHRAALDSALISARRLMDSCDCHDERGGGALITLRKSLPQGVIATPPRLKQIVEQVSARPPVNSLTEVQLQNKELLDTLSELRAKQDDLLALTQELEDTNRGVVALYAEIEEKAERLRESEEHFRQMAENIDDVFWICSLVDRELLYVSEAYDLIWGASRNALEARPEAWLESVHYDDRNRVEQSFYRLFENQPYEEQFRIVLPDGKLRWVRDRAFPVKNAANATYRIARITSDISASKLAEKMLQDADTHKDEFLATLAHELRAPLAPIRNAIEIMQKPTPLNAEEHAFTRQVILRQVDHMTRLVNDLLDSARISQGKIVLQLAPVEINELVRTAIETSMPLIIEREHALEVVYAEQPAWVAGDAVRLAQTVNNLLNNAAKYTSHGGIIEVRIAQRRMQGGAQKDTQNIVISVNDNGIGISEARAKTIFNLFSQGDVTPDQAQDGLGIGLSLVKKLIELHGGAVSVQSAGHGCGSRFELTLPMADPVANDASDKSSASGQQTAARLPAERVLATSVSVLIVDDNADASTTTAILLGAYGHKTYTARNGQEALTAAREYKPDVILLDLGLPGMNGYEIARVLRGEPAFIGTKLIAVTGYGSEKDRERTKEAGFNHHVVKPADIDHLLTLIGDTNSA
ncbi:MAG: hybrid sensor histidine kinase/response regulator [Herbaspirillum sp.]|nr:hybrid sensor histidine kinase/response regulator [Herbaspirillum sp.]